jgi:uncharacterized membrane protein
MDQKINDKRDLKVGMIHFTLFVILIFAGIFVKRVLGHPEYMMLFHGPAAVFLIVAGMKLTAKNRRRFAQIRDLK